MGVWVVFVNRQPQYFVGGVGYHVEDADPRLDSSDDNVDTIHVVDTEGKTIATFPAASVWEVELKEGGSAGA